MRDREDRVVDKRAGGTIVTIEPAPATDLYLPNRSGVGVAVFEATHALSKSGPILRPARLDYYMQRRTW